MTGTTPPPLHGPSSKEKKYDRQLRLWAASGQAALEEAHVLLINSGPAVVGIEALKNLVLPGVGHFTIVDPATVTEADLGVNFFLDEDSLGQPRAQRCCELLRELNPDVEGNYLQESIDSLVATPDLLKPYTIFLLTAPVTTSSLNVLSQYAQAHRIPIFHIHSVGFYAHFSLALPSAFPIVDTHPEPTSTSELRLLNPWPELEALVHEKTRSLDTLSDHEHGHIPYVLLLLHYLEQWRKEHGGHPPQNYKEKSEFRELVRKGARTSNPEGGEENYDEAVGAVLKSLNPPSLSSTLRDVFEAEECKRMTMESNSAPTPTEAEMYTIKCLCGNSEDDGNTVRCEECDTWQHIECYYPNAKVSEVHNCIDCGGNFWLIASAINIFYTNHKLLPLPGSVPDMKAQSEDYIQLQNVYKSKARKDHAEVLSTVRSLEKSLGRETVIDEKEVEAFCKGASFVKLIRGRSLHATRGTQHGDSWGDRAKFVQQELRDPDSLLPIYITFLAYDRMGDALAVNKEDHLRRLAMAILYELWEQADGSECKVDEDVKTRVGQVVQEVIRADGSELHNISALAGGMVAQEVIKVITKQYVPIDNTCTFDGITSKSSVIRL
ncbi:MAG: hypothetical protein M1827_002476 [Pycnora praestabilis]|nr:MAG: hypothetical protein M1827_002476 [Pycnora praestabilis]